MILTLAALCVTWSNDDRPQQSENEHPSRLAQNFAATWLLRTAAIAAAGLAINRLCIAPYRGNLILREVAARSLHAQSLDDRHAIDIAHTNLHDLDQAASGRRLDPAWYLLYGTNCETLGRWTEAAATYTGANPGEVVDALGAHANRLAQLAADAGPVKWTRGLTIGDSRSDVRRMLEHALHDSSHHIGDVERGFASLPR
jgi:hypothetical protein